MVMLLLKKGLPPPGELTGAGPALTGYLNNPHRVVYRTARCESPRCIIPRRRRDAAALTPAFLLKTASTETLQPSINQSFGKRNRCSEPASNGKEFYENKMI
jgi:hypothetical protein